MPQALEGVVIGVERSSRMRNGEKKLQNHMGELRQRKRGSVGINMVWGVIWGEVWQG